MGKCGTFLQACPQGCGLGLYEKDFEFHIKNQCSETCTVCENCEEKIYTNRGGEPHDCMKTMKE